MMKRYYLILLSLWIVLAAPAQAATPLDRIVAVVNDDVVLESELRDGIRTIVSQIQQKGDKLPPQDVLVKQVLGQLIMNKLQLQVAENTGIRVDDETLNRAINDIAARNKLSLSDFRRILEQDGYNYEAFRQKIRNEMIIARLRARQVENRISVTDVEIDNYLATRELQGGGEKQYRLSHILIALSQDASDEIRELAHQVAEQILVELEAGRDFAALARKYSDSPQAKNGGDLGWRKLKEIPSLLSDEVRNMKVGDVSSIIEDESGFHIFELTDTRTDDVYMETQTHARHILLKTDELNNEAEVRTRLEQLRQRILNGEDFGELARASSADTASAINGGDLGWISPGSLVSKFEEVMDSLKPGEISEPFQTNYGWHIVQVLDRREQDSTVEYRRSQARAAIRERKSEEVLQNWLREIHDEAYIDYRLGDQQPAS